MSEYCTSGKAIPAIGMHTNRPCGEPLVVIAKSGKGNPVTVCPKCDALPRTRVP